MRVAFDTSVLVAGIVEAHPSFERAAPWLDAADRGELETIWTTHSYAECWSVLTRLPIAGRLEPDAANAVLAAFADAHAPEAISIRDYQSAGVRCAELGLRSGAIYDALHLIVAERRGADALLTLNVRDFERLLPRIRVVEPQATVALP